MKIARGRRLATAGGLGLALAAGALVVTTTAQGAAPVAAPVLVQSQVLTSDVADPTSIDVARDGRVFIAERTGDLKVWHQDGTQKTIGTIKVSACGFDCDGTQLEEGGLHGLLLDRDFLKTRKLFAYYSVPNSLNKKTGEGKFRLSTFTLAKNGMLDLRSEKVLLENPAEWAHCCHYGGDLDWMKDGTILLTVADDTSPREEGWAPRDKRKGREAFNAERTSQNPKDRRGKVLRLNPDGSVPANNPFVKDKRYDPYVYAMGFRSNYRMAVDDVTGSVFVGNVGPDAQQADPARGPAGMDELETIPKRGGTNHGWPRCIGNNTPYVDFDYATQKSKGLLSCKGMTPATIYYGYAPSTEFPVLAAGTRTMMAGTVYRYQGDGALQLPSTYQGHLLMMEWSRLRIYTAPVKADGQLDTSKLMPLPGVFKEPADMAIGPDGAVYLVEYGEFYYDNQASQISRLTCAGCLPNPDDYKVAAGSTAGTGAAGTGGTVSAPDTGAGAPAAGSADRPAAAGDAPAERPAAPAAGAPVTDAQTRAASADRGLGVPVLPVAAAAALALLGFGAWRRRRLV